MKRNPTTLTEERALERLAALCARSEHCTSEVADKCRRWGLTPDATQRVIDYLLDHQFVDDERWTEAFIEDKIKFNAWGRRKIEQALWQKHIDKSLYQPILDAVPDEEYEQQLFPLMQAKWKNISAETERERAQKLIRWALQRGFSFSIIRHCIDMMEEEVDHEDMDALQAESEE